MCSFRRVVVDLYTVSVCDHVNFNGAAIWISFQFMSINRLGCCLLEGDVFKKMIMSGH